MSAPGYQSEIFAYLMTDDEGYTGIAMAETAGAARIPLVAPDLKGARLLHAIAVKIGEMSNRPITLAHFTNRTDLEVIDNPEDEP